MHPETHTNTVVNLLTGTGGGSLVVGLLKHYGVDVSVETGILIAGATGSFFLFIGHDGIRGAVRKLWRGGSS